MSAASAKSIAASVKNQLLAAARQSGKPFEGWKENCPARLSHDSDICRRLNDCDRRLDDWFTNTVCNQHNESDDYDGPSDDYLTIPEKPARNR